MSSTSGAPGAGDPRTTGRGHGFGAAAPFEVLFGDGFPFPWFPDADRAAMSGTVFSCTEVLAMLDGFLAGELSVAQAEKIGAHLKACASCREALRLQEGVRALLRRADTRTAPPGLRQQVIDSLREEDRRPPD